MYLQRVFAHKEETLANCLHMDVMRCIVLAESLRTQRRNIKKTKSFFGLEKNDENPYYEIIFADKQIIQLRFLEAEISTQLGKARVNVLFLRGNETFEEKVR